MNNYRLTKAAESDLLGIAIYGYETFGAVRAEQYREALRSQIEILAASPKLYRERTRFSPPVRICPFQSHVIIYRIMTQNEIEIIRVRHGREDWLP